MKHTIFLALFLGLLAVFDAKAGLSVVEIKATREKLDETKDRSYGETTITKEIVYNVDIENTTFKPLTNLEVKYMIFYEVNEAGSTDDGQEKSQRGTETIANLPQHRSYSFKSKAIKLNKTELDGNFYYSSGANGRARDKVNGLWFRVYSEGQLIGEYCNPTSIGKRVWKD